MDEIHIDEVYPKTESYPFIAHFQNGYPTDSFGDQECEVLEHRIYNKKEIACEINNILYAGEESEEPLGRTFILIRNRETGKTRLVEAGNVELQPLMKNKIKSPELETSYVDLGRKFGSKRHKKILEQNEKLKVNEELVMEQLKDVSQNVSVDQLDLSSYNKTDSEEFYIPPINREANDVEDVYSLAAILTEDQYDQIFSEIDSSEYKTDLFPYIKEIFSDKWSKEQTVLAVYASTLLNLNNKTMKEIKLKNFVAFPHSSTLDKIVLNEFFTYNGNSRLRPLNYKDKGICYAIILLFLVNNYKIDIESFCKHTKLVERTANVKISMTGGWPVKQGNRKVAVLKVPLNKASTGYSRRKSVKS